MSMQIMPTTFNDVIKNNKNRWELEENKIQGKQNNINDMTVSTNTLDGFDAPVVDNSSKIGLVNATLLEELLENQANNHAEMMKAIHKLV